MSSPTKKDDQSGTATTTASAGPSHADVPPPTTAPQQTYDQVLNSSIHSLANTSIHNTVTMEHRNSNTATSSTPASFAGTATTLTDMADAEGHHSRAIFSRIKKSLPSIRRPRFSHAGKKNQTRSLSPSKRNDSSHHTNLDASKTGQQDGQRTGKRRKTITTSPESEPLRPARQQRQHSRAEDGEQEHDQQPSTPQKAHQMAVYDAFFDEPLTPPPTAPNSEKSTCHTSTTSANAQTPQTNTVLNQNCVLTHNKTNTTTTVTTTQVSHTPSPPPTPTPAANQRKKLSTSSQKTLQPPTPTKPKPQPKPHSTPTSQIHARTLSAFRGIFARSNVHTRPARRACLHARPAHQWSDGARWMFSHCRDIWEDSDEEESGFTEMFADKYVETLEERFEADGEYWEYVFEERERGNKVEVRQAQIRNFGLTWGAGEGRWEGRSGGLGGLGGEVGPRGERVEES